MRDWRLNLLIALAGFNLAVLVVTMFLTMYVFIVVRRAVEAVSQIGAY